MKPLDAANAVLTRKRQAKAQLPVDRLLFAIVWFFIMLYIVLSITQVIPPS